MNTLKSLLNRLCGAKLETRKDIEKQLKQHYFIDPIYVSSTDALPDRDPLKIEARVIADCFEAVTNGMYDDNILAILEKIEEDAFFADWRYFTEFLYYYYKGDQKKAIETKYKILPTSIPALMLPLLAVLVKETSHIETEALSESKKNLFTKIEKDNFALQEKLSKAVFFLETEAEEEFTDIITMIVSDMFSKNRNISKTISVWALRQFFSKELEPEQFIENMRLIFGETEAFRLSALALMEEDAELSLFFWLKSAISMLKRSVPGGGDEAEVEAYLDIIKSLYSDIKSCSVGIDKELEQTNCLLFIALDKEIKNKYQGIFELPEIKLSSTTRQTALKTKKKVTKQEVMQLELFQ